MFGVERRGAPVAAFVRMDEQPIDIKTQIYEPDIVIVLDPSLMDVVDVSDGLKQGGKLIINSAKAPDAFQFGDADVYTVDATTIAVNNGLGTETNPIVNTAILGAFAYATGIVKIESIVDSILESAPAKRKENAEAAKEAYEAVHVGGT